MRANAFGFTTAPKPCPNGKCSTTSECTTKVIDQASNTYGSGAGYTINTKLSFSVKSEFISSSDKLKLRGTKTTLTQEGSIVVIESDCRDYISTLAAQLRGQMGLAVSSFAQDDIDVQGNKCTGKCDNGTPIIFNV